MNEQVILDFVTNWRASQGIPADGSALTQAQLREFAVDVSGQVQQLSVRPSDPNGVRTWAANANPLGYSAGLDPNGVPAYRAAEVISGSSGGKIYYISDTPAGRFINDPLFIEELKLQVGGNDALAVAERLVRGNYPAEGRRMST